MALGARVEAAAPTGDIDSLIFHDPTDTVMTPQKIILLCILSASNVFMLLGNAASIYIIAKSPSLRQHTYYWLVLNLAVLDLMNSLFVVPINIVWEFYGYWPFSQTLCDLEIFCDLGFSTVAAYSTVLLSLDKYLYITKPFFYHSHVGPRSTLVSILLTWLVWITYSAASVFGKLARSTKEYKYDFPLDNCNFVLRHAFAITSFILVFFIPLIILIFTSSRILFVARTHIRKINTNHRASEAAAVSPDVSMFTRTIAQNASMPAQTTFTSVNNTSVSVHNSNASASVGSITTPAPNTPSPVHTEAAYENNSTAAPNSTTNTVRDSERTFGARRYLDITTATVFQLLSPTSTANKDSDSSAGVPVNSKTTNSNTLQAPASKSPTGNSLPACDKTSKRHQASASKRPTASSFRALGTVTLVVLAFIVMFAPYWIASVVNLGCTCIQPLVFEDYLAPFYYMHSLVNPYIYMATDRRYKKAIRHLWPLVFEDYLAPFYYMHSLVNPYIYMATDRRYKKAIRHLWAKSPCRRNRRRNSVTPNIHISSLST
ncbi:D(2) dopamine receptor A-like [Littorina saxatilis]|uniref:D(2) dopamine receptor A-like n=1 Tax=Littorina saxatilis TaxID=31220 RepID=UPI0038B5E69F